MLSGLYFLSFSFADILGRIAVLVGGWLAVEQTHDDYNECRNAMDGGQKTNGGNLA